MMVNKGKNFKNGKLSGPSFTCNKKHQVGMVVLAVVAILLGIVTFATVTTSQSVQQFYTLEKVRRDAESIQIKLKQHAKNIARALRSQKVSNVLTTTNSANLTTTVQVSE